ncbi:MAG: BolA family transcriptional regulator [Hydrogenophaga sp.]|jgi:BolA family transcriptional regulator, general stress-responsive regulator|uniref:BolA family protein n=1 Tax=Hydrogenophaga sp. TaxID=1904254 RepID=UPI00257F0901|nr:BolA family protein [Hydrogenophaga sp.]MBL0945970.1 BolA family transcriptional regulator [Hydrogenophaga sp.]
MTAAAIPTAAAIEARLREQLAPSALEVIDESAAHAGHAGANGLGYGTHFRVRIAAPAFVGLGRVAQHRLVYDALRPFTDAGLHALAIEIQR